MKISNLPIKQMLIQNTTKLYNYKYHVSNIIDDGITFERKRLFHIFRNMDETFTPEEMDYIKNEGVEKMVKYRIIQMGSQRSIVECLYLDTKEKQVEMINNDYLMLLDGYGYVL